MKTKTEVLNDMADDIKDSIDRFLDLAQDQIDHERQLRIKASDDLSDMEEKYQELVKGMKRITLPVGLPPGYGDEDNANG